ncbi:serine/threonine protein kinase [Steroidobacter flavus]|uniref:Serine/threonine protein kinase n=1 Tax=Steroidobacter flavus TaxID=1842136 RepID=A0ABV8T187_9GAMM
MGEKDSAESLDIAQRWCRARGEAWRVLDEVGRGGTAPVYTVASPDGELALKIYDEKFSTGDLGRVEAARVERQVALGRHACPTLVQVFDGGRFESRLFVLMNRAPGMELEKVLRDVPRNKIRGIVDQVASAVLFLRQHDLCHRDVKSANVFVTPDFSQATLLDVSVTRDIHDPVGIGTDHEGQLPVVATARYSPPEYLFRLLEPSEELWHALDVYQLGALLYDLIAREPLFEAEYRASKENRYRFAWAVATVHPELIAHDVDDDLIFLARRALDKDWRRRSAIALHDFLADAESNRKRAMATLGLGTALTIGERTLGPTRAMLRSQLQILVATVEDRTREHLQKLGITAKHTDLPGPVDLSKSLRFAWKADPAGSPETQFDVCVRVIEDSAGISFACSTELAAVISGTRRQATIELPQVRESAAAAVELGELCEAALPELARMITQANPSGE